MIWKLLRKNISPWQLAGYAAAMLIGLAIVMTAVQFYRDGSHAFAPAADGGGGIGLSSRRTIVISKPVTLNNTLKGSAPMFSTAEINELERQPWCAGVSAFRAADFSVWAGIELGGRTLQTALFFESVPDSLIDIDPEAWTFDPSSPAVPVIIAKDYLALYNFGFAASGRMPPVSEAMLSTVPLRVTLSGQGRSVTLPGRIVGFSTWLNTVAVPEQFMDWAHRQFGSGEAEQPSRLIVEVSDKADPAVDRFLTSHRYEVAGNDSDDGRTGYLIRLLATVVGAIGVLITLLALGILMLSLYLLVEKNRRVIDGLVLLGYTPRTIAGCYRRLVAVLNIAIFVPAAAAVTLAAHAWGQSLAKIGLDGTSILPTLLLGLLTVFAITALNYLTIGRLINK